MIHRLPTWWRALGVVLLSLATVTWPSAAQADATSPSFQLLHQDPVAVLSAPGRSHFGIVLSLSTPDHHAAAQLSLYPRLVTRSQIAPLISGAGDPARAVSTTGNFAMNCNARRPMNFTIGLFTVSTPRGSSPCSGRQPRLRLRCRGASCDGVYPLSYSVTSGGVTTTKWSMLAVRASAVTAPLHVDLVVSLDPSSWRHRTRTAKVLAVLARHPGVPLTLTADYRTLAPVMSAPPSASAHWRHALDLALQSPLHRVVIAPPTNVDFGGLATIGLYAQVRGQLSLASEMVHTLTGRFVDAPLIVSGRPSIGSLAALGHVGMADVVLPEGALATAPTTTLGWGAPFRVAGAPGIVALASDDQLNRLASTASIEPGRRVALALGTLAFLHFQAPFATAVRTVVVDLSPAHCSATFTADLLTAFARNPFFVASSLVPSFSSSLIASNGAPAVRTLSRGTPSPWSSLNVSSLRSLVSSIDSYVPAVSSKEVVTALRVMLARAEVTGGALARQQAINRASDLLDSQLGQISVDANAITLAGPGTALPITLINKAPYTITVVVHLITDRLAFPKGRDVAVSLDSPTNSLRVPTGNRQGSSLTLQVEVTTPDGHLTLARAAIQVRVAGTSIVGYLLTLGSLLVIGAWWIRTHRRRTKGRHAR